MKPLLIAISALLAGCDGIVDHSPLAAQARIQAGLTDAQKAALAAANGDESFKGADLGLWIRGERLAQVINSINSLPPASRSITLQVTAQRRKLEDKGNYFVELYDLPGNRATGSISNVVANWTPGGILTLVADLALSGTGKIHAHYKPANVGAHAGFNLATTARLNGKLHLTPSKDPASFFDVNFELLPTPIDMSLSTSLKDEKEWCWRIGPAKDCKTLWSYNIPVGLSLASTAKTDKLYSMPVNVQMPNSIRLAAKADGVSFDKSISLLVKPKSFSANAFGISVLTSVHIAQTDGTAKDRAK